MIRPEITDRINGLLRAWFELQSENKLLITSLVTWEKFEEASALRKKEDKLAAEITTLLEQCRESQMAVNLHLDSLRDRYYRDSIRVWDYDEFTSFIRHFHLPDLVLFEYDLDEEQQSYECAKFLINYCLENNLHLPSFKVYGISHNSRKDLRSLLADFQTRALKSNVKPIR